MQACLLSNIIRISIIYEGDLLMAGSTYGTLFTMTTWGESHGPAIGVVVDGCPAGLPLSEGDIQGFLDRRKPGPVSYTHLSLPCGYQAPA